MRDPGPLEGVRVLSLAEQYPGPYATLVLEDLGADVVLVERPQDGDPTRAYPDFFEALNRSKRSVALDLKSDEGRAALRRLVESADVVLEGFRPGTTARLGSGYDDLAAVNPALVYVSISGFGQDGPARDRVAHDLSNQAVAGVLYDRLEHEPADAYHLQLGDLSSGLFAAIATLAGLYARERTGRGGHFDVAMTDCLVSLMTTQLFSVINGLGAGPAPFLAEPGYRLYRTARRASAEPQRRARGSLLGGALSGSRARRRRWPRRAGAARTPRGTRWPSCRRNRAQDAQRMGRDARGGTRRLRSRARPGRGCRGPQVRHRGQIVAVPGDGALPSRWHVAQPIRIDGRLAGPLTRAPRLGEHTAELLS